MNEWLNVLFSILSGALTQQQKDDLANLDANWVLLNTRNGRFFIDVCAPKQKLLNIRDYLIAAGRDPKIIAILEHHDTNGTEVLRNATTFDLVEYLNVAPDVRTYNAAGQLLSSVRPLAFTETHRFSGWGPKVLT